MSLYERYVLPMVLNCACSSKPITYQRRKVVPLARGRVLELGIGSGLNLPYYDPARVERVIGIDPSAELWKRARSAVEAVKFPVEHLAAKAEDMPLTDKSIDTAVITFTLCTIPDAIKALAGVRRVLKPDGEVLFCEHGLAPDLPVARWQGRLNGLWGAIAGGCNLNRPIPALLEAGGFRIERLETMYLPGTPKFAGYNYWGSARAA